MTKLGIRVIQKGDIEHTPPDEQDYSSEFQSPKVSIPFRGSFKTDANGDGSIPLPHNFGYSPVAHAFYKFPSTNWLAVDNSLVGVETNRNNFVMRLAKHNPGDPVDPLLANITVQYKIWLLLDPAQEI